MKTAPGSRTQRDRAIQAVRDQWIARVGVNRISTVYSDRAITRLGDYKRLAFLPYASLVLEVRPDCPPALRAEIEEDARHYQARRGERLEVTCAGQTVLLGKKEETAAPHSVSPRA